MPRVRQPRSHVRTVPLFLFLLTGFASMAAGLCVVGSLTAGCSAETRRSKPQESLGWTARSRLIQPSRLPKDLDLSPERSTETESQSANVHSTPDQDASDFSDAGDEPPAASSETTDSASAAGYTIGTGDLLQVSIFNIPLTEETVIPRKTVVKVGEGGRITVPLLGEVQATGITARALEQKLHDRYKTYIRDPQVGVLVKNAGTFFVDGAVRKPGSYPLDRPYTLTQALIAAGGLNYDLARYSDVTIARRKNDKQTETISVDLNKIRGGKATDPLVYAGDVILVAIDTAKYIIHRFLGSLGASAPIPLP